LKQKLVIFFIRYFLTDITPFSVQTAIRYIGISIRT
jgi:hypothetical protein